MRFALPIFVHFMVLLALIGPAPTTEAQDIVKPLDLPVAAPAGPSTWMLGQPYGNTVGAYFNGDRWYSAGQRLHFGLDFSMPCGTPLIAVADGTVAFVDDPGFGSLPHNLILRHEAVGLTTLYGHLLDRPVVEPGQQVRRGDLVGYSGDPDSTCDSRPHLHFEVRSLDYFTAYNPVESMNAAWHSLSAIGSFSAQSFQRDLDNPRQWLTLFDQPSVAFGGRALNAYAAAWPAGNEPPNNPPLLVNADPLPAEVRLRQRRLSEQGCCFWPWWDAVAGNTLYTIDGGPGQRAGLFQWQIGDELIATRLQDAPPAFTSPDGSHTLRIDGDEAILRRPSDGAEWRVNTGGNPPAFSTDNRRLLWLDRVDVPGSDSDVAIWIADADGSNARQIAYLDSGYAVWLDEARLLLVSQQTQASTLSVHDSRDGSTLTLGTWERVRGLTVAPGGGRLMFYLSYHADEAINGVYSLRTEADAAPVKMPWFGAWRWRDANSVYYIPFDPSTNQQSLAYYDILTGENRPLTDPATMPFTIANGDWRVSADGKRIVYLNATDLSSWVMELAQS